MISPVGYESWSKGFRKIWVKETDFIHLFIHLLEIHSHVSDFPRYKRADSEVSPSHLHPPATLANLPPNSCIFSFFCFLTESLHVQTNASVFSFSQCFTQMISLFVWALTVYSPPSPHHPQTLVPYNNSCSFFVMSLWASRKVLLFRSRLSWSQLISWSRMVSAVIIQLYSTESFTFQLVLIVVPWIPMNRSTRGLWEPRLGPGTP